MARAHRKTLCKRLLQSGRTYEQASLGCGEKEACSQLEKSEPGFRLRKHCIPAFPSQDYPGRQVAGVRDGAGCPSPSDHVVACINFS